jgi:Zn finger protein HypA/HybF involved in hydrogenase expression
MEERDIDRAVSSPNSFHARPRLRAPRQGSTEDVSDEDVLARINRQIAELEVTHRVEFRSRWEWQGDEGSPGSSCKVVETYPVGSDADLKLFRELHEKRGVLERRIGPMQLPAGFVHQFHRNGIGYSFSPYWAWASEYFSVSACPLKVRGNVLNLRDTLIWFLWHFRDKAVISSGQLTSKVRQARVECADCGRHYSSFVRGKVVTPRRGCPKCGSPRHRDLTANIGSPTSFGSITKIGLQRRFKLGQRELARVLSAVPVRPDDGPEPVLP